MANKTKKSKQNNSSHPILLDDENSFPIVGIGASAGGLEAFEKFFTNMPPDSGMGFVLVQHLDPTHKSIVTELLRKYTTMDIHQVNDGMKVKPNCVYVIPPNKDMAIINGLLQLLDTVGFGGQRHHIDYFFRSLAQDQHKKAFGIILSGTGTDGTLGVKAIKSEGGYVIVQDPKSAKYDGMPTSAISTDSVNSILPVEMIPARLLRLVKSDLTKTRITNPRLKKTAEDSLHKLFILLRDQTGNDFSLYKQNTIFRRIERRLSINQIDTMANYVRFLQRSSTEVQILFKDLIIEVTNFFRDPRAFESLRKKFLPQLTKGKSLTNPLRIWVVGCSTGEEAYSIAIIIKEYMAKTRQRFTAHIFAMDLNEDSIEKARTGTYPLSIKGDVSAKRLNRFFVKNEKTYQIKSEIRDMIVFAKQNIIKDPVFSKIDLLTCRNLLIYLSPELQKKVMRIFHYSLNPNGTLFLGSSETIGEQADLFSISDKKGKFYQRKGFTTLPLPLYQSPTETYQSELGKPDEAKNGKYSSITEIAKNALLENFTPPGVIINEKGGILYFHGETRSLS